MMTWFGAQDGVVKQPSGDYVAKCFDGYWWAGPACRQDTTKCLPVITDALAGASRVF